MIKTTMLIVLMVAFMIAFIGVIGERDSENLRNKLATLGVASIVGWLIIYFAG